MKLMFLISRDIPSYHFVPYDYGPFSFELYRDMNWLDEHEKIDMDENNVLLLDHDFEELGGLDQFMIQNKEEEFSKLSDKELMDKVYSSYPWYTIFSKYHRQMEYYRNEKGLVSIGYEGKTIDEFLNELLKCKVQVLIDVRRNPFSRKFGFSKGKLNDYCEKLGMEYRHIPELGIGSQSRKDLITIADYRRIFKVYDNGLAEKEDHIKKIVNSAQNKRTAIFCFERDPQYCHRNVIANRIKGEGVEVINI